MKQDMTLGKWIIQKCNTKQWRDAELSGIKTINTIQPILDILGRKMLLSQAKQLVEEKYIKIKWAQVNTEIKSIIIITDRLDDLCDRENVDNPRTKFEEKRQQIITWLAEFGEEEDKEWIVKFYEKILCQMQTATKHLPEYARDDMLLICLNAISRLQEDVWKRVFSNNIFEDSKVFEDAYQAKVINVLCKFSNRVSTDMEADEILTEFKILSYSQMLECKGSFQYEITIPQYIAESILDKNIHSKTNVDTSVFYFGHNINAQTLTWGKVIDVKDIRKVMTIENKANYESMTYDKHCLYIFTHGFFSFKERAFLATLNQLLPETVEFYHWSDMDYGGFRIFQFVKNRVFSGRNIKPFKMGEREYVQAMNRQTGKEIGASTREKLEKIDVPELRELKACILKYGKVFEQEHLI